MNPFFNEELRDGDHITECGSSMLADNYNMDNQRTHSECSFDSVEDGRFIRSSTSISDHDLEHFHEAGMIVDERNTSSVALVEPALTRDRLATAVLHPPKSRFAEAEDEKRPDSSNQSRASSVSCLLYDDRIAKAATSDLLADEYPLPKIQGPLWYNRLRYHYLSVRLLHHGRHRPSSSYGRHELTSLDHAQMYVRLHIIVLLINLGAIIPVAIGSQRGKPTFTHQDASTAFAANMFVIFLTRNEHFINTLFHIFRGLNRVSNITSIR